MQSFVPLLIGVFISVKEVLYCAKKAGVTHILKAGGAQVFKLLNVNFCNVIDFPVACACI